MGQLFGVLDNVDYVWMCLQLVEQTASGQARVVMDILLFEDMTAEESIRFAVFKKHSAGQRLFTGFAAKVVPAIREALASKEPVSDEPCRQALSAYLSRWIERAATKSESAACIE